MPIRTSRALAVIPDFAALACGRRALAAARPRGRLLVLVAVLLPFAVACPEVEGVDTLPDGGEGVPDAGPPVVEPSVEPEDDCPIFPVAGIEAVVRDQEGTRVCDARVIASDGNFSEVLQGADVDGPLCRYFGVFERPGTYVVTVAAEGFLTATETDVIISLNPCGDARTQAVDVSLTPGEDPIADAGPQPEPTPEPVPEPEPEPDPAPLACPGGLVTAAGDLTVSSEQDLADLQPIECVAGTLRLTATAFAAATAPNLQVVGRDVIIDAAPTLTTVDFAALTDVGRDLVVEDNAAFDELRMDALVAVGRDVVIGNAGKPLPALTDLDLLTALESVGGDFHVENTGVQALNQNFDALQTITGFFYVVDNTALTQIRLVNAMPTLGGFVVKNNPELTSLRARGPIAGFSRLETVDNPQLATFDFRAVTTISGDVLIERCAITDGDFRDLAAVNGDFTLNETEIDATDGAFGALQTVGGGLTVTRNPQLPEADALDWAAGVTATTTTICENQDGTNCL